jgi:hypothetical protein
VSVKMMRVSGNFWSESGRCLSRALEPGVLIGRVVHHELDEHPDVAPMGSVDERLEVVERAVAGVDRAVVGDVVPVVLQRGGKERQEPDARDPQALQIVQLLGEAVEVADAVVRAVEERLDVRLIDDGVLVPERIVGALDGVRVGVGHQVSRKSQVTSRKSCVRCQWPLASAA